MAISTDSPSACTFSIPRVDIAPYLLSPTSPEALEIVEQVRAACLTTGFFQLVGHGIPRSVRDDVFRAAEAFFNLPLEEKKKLDKSKSVGASNRGYELIGSQGLQEGTLPDLKEGFYIGKDIPADDPRVQRKVFLMGPNVWPPLPEEIFKEPVSKYHTLVFDLSLTVLDILAAGLPYGPDVFKDFISNDPVCPARLLHYPPGPTPAASQSPSSAPSSTSPSTSPTQLGAGAHTDFGAITLLLQDGIGGLQVWDPDPHPNQPNQHSEEEEVVVGEEEGGGGGVHTAQGEWRDVDPDPDAYVVNIGDMLQMWTGAEYKSSLHRVINASGGDRYSVPFFFDGNVECVLSPLGASGASGRRGGSENGRAAAPLTVEEHMRERFASTYGRGRKKEEEEE